MDMDWTSMFGNEATSSAFKAPSAKEDPLAWLEHELESDGELCYLQVAPARWQAKALKKAGIIKVEVELDQQGLVVVEADSGILVPAEHEIAFRTFQMIENGSFKTAGYRMAEAGDNVRFRVCLRPSDDLDMETLVGRCVYTLGDQASTFAKIAEGLPLSKVYAETRMSQMTRALTLHRLSEGDINGVEDLMRLQEALG